jgi:hypothetical protein
MESQTEQSTQIHKDSFWDIYPKEVAESFILILIIQAIMDKEIDFVSIIKNSLVLGLIVFIAISIIGVEFKSHVKEGLRNSVGYYIFKTFST